MSRIEALVNRIEDLQFKSDSRYFASGMFASERSNSFIAYSRKDSNIYFPALIAFTLLQLIKTLDKTYQKRILAIAEKVVSNYPKYESKRFSGQYNFYQTQANKHYPNGYFLSRIKHFSLAEDADDTVIITLTKQALGYSTEREINNIRGYLTQFSNLEKKKVTSMPLKYQNLKTYGVWFGSGKMPIEFDLCVISNVLYFVFHNNLPLRKEDLDGLLFIKKALTDNDINKYPFTISYMYPDPVIILYHIARLWSVIPEASSFLPKQLIIEKLKFHLSNTSSKLKEILLSTSLIKMGVHTPEVLYSIDSIKEEFKSFGFFRAPMLKGTDIHLLNKMATFPYFQMLYDCEAYYYTLVLEYEVLTQ